MYRIAHFGDVHIHNLQRHDEYRTQFEKIYEKLEEQKPDRIVISGDLFEKFVEISNEAKALSSDFLKKLASFCKVIIVPGNHDLMKKNKKRLNSVFTLVHIMDNPNIVYYGKSGFYNDDDIVWVNYSHLEKDIIPWVNIPHTKDKDKIYIALYHDPIVDSVTSTGMAFRGNKYKSMSDFKDNDFVMLADIHKHQYFRRNKSAAYCGSTIQQDFGETPDNHGYLLWDIESRTKFKSEFIEIPNEYNYINFYLHKDEGIDYDDLDFNHPLLNEKSSVKVHWTELSANINFENELKIRKYFKEVHNIPSIKIDRNRIYTDVSKVEMVSESIDILDSSVHRKIFIEFLDVNGYDEQFIEKVLKIDDIISERLNIDKDNLGIVWDIEKVWFNNFKSYGDDVVVDFKEMGQNALIQVGGENQQGKTTILDAISYILYGKTTTTLKREKNGDNRYINNKRDLDYCDGGTHININGNIFTVIRRTERKWNRAKTDITSCSTVVDYYKGYDTSEDNKLTDEDKNKTQSFIESAIGDFDDFIRLILTTADNINEILSMDRAVFIDSIIKDAGYDIFEKKLAEFKDYKKTETKDDIKIDVSKYKKSIEEKEENLLNYKQNKNRFIDEIKELEDSKLPLLSKKDDLLTDIDKIDERISNIDVDELNLSIDSESEKITTRKEQLKKIDELKLEILSYDADKVKNKRIELNTLKDTVSDNNTKISEYSNKITELSGDIKTINKDIENIIDSHIRSIEDDSNKLEKDLSDTKDNFKTKVIEYSSVLKDDLNNIVSQKNDYKKDIDNLKEEGKKLKTLNEELESSKVCITCERPLDDVDPSIINSKIENNKKELSKIIAKYKEINPKYEELSKSIDTYKDKLDKLSKGVYDFDDELNLLHTEYNNKKKEADGLIIDNERKINLIKDGNLPSDLQEKLKPSNNDKNIKLEKISELEDSKKDLEKVNEIKSDEIEKVKKEIEELEKEESKYQKKKDAISLEEKVKADIERCENLIKDYQRDIDSYNSQLEKIKNNDKIKSEIETINSEISEINDNISNKVDSKTQMESKIAVLENEIKNLQKDIKTFEKQKERDEILDVYMKCVHRDGLPSYLLKKSIHVINQELNNLLTDVDFNLFFDDELNLKLNHDVKIESTQNAIESSGMERTFCAIALKMALRKINSKSRPNFIMLDEIMLKLLNASVDKFIVLLDNIKTQVDKLVIIEHIHPINYDVLIQVVKNNLGISNLEIEN